MIVDIESKQTDIQQQQAKIIEYNFDINHLDGETQITASRLSTKTVALSTV